MNETLSTIGDALGNAFQMAWEVWWTLILGFMLSGIVQAWVSGATDPVCRMRVDRFTKPHRAEHAGQPYYFCTAGCREEFESKPDHYAHQAHRTRGGRPRGLLRARS